MSETMFKRVLDALHAAGPDGIRTDTLAKQTQCRPMVLNNYIKRHRQAGEEIHPVLGVHAPSTLFCRLEWAEAAKAKRQAEIKARSKSRERKRTASKSELAAIRKAKAQAEAAAKVAMVRSAPKVEQPRPQHVGELPPAHILPHQPVYSRHQLTDLPEGWQSPLSASECRPWAMMVGQG